MAILDVLWDPILPVFATLALGFFLGRVGRVGVEDARAVNRLAMNVFLPVMLFGLVAEAPLSRFSPGPLALYLGAEALVFAFGFLVARRVFRLEPGEAALLAFCGIFANNAYYTLPIAILVYGEAEALPITMITLLDTVVAFAGMMVALQLIGGGGVSLLRVGRVVLGTPVLQAILLGFAVNFSQVPIPAPVETFVDFAGSAAPPVGLFALGVVLSSTPFRVEAPVVAFSATKVFLFPGLVWLGLALLAPSDPDRDRFVLGSAGPSGTMAFSMALLHGVRTEAIAQVIIWTCVLTLVTLAVLA